MNRIASSSERLLVASAIARLRAGVLAIVCGLFAGSGLLIATVWLIVRGGADVGQHLGLLGHYLPGYSVTWWGAVLGFFYGLLVGGACGWVTAWIYNRLVSSKHPTDSLAG